MTEVYRTPTRLENRFSVNLGSLPLHDCGGDYPPCCPCSSAPRSSVHPISASPVLSTKNSRETTCRPPLAQKWGARGITRPPAIVRMHPRAIGTITSNLAGAQPPNRTPA